MTDNRPQKTSRIDTPVLDSITEMKDLRALKPDQLKKLADEVRAEMIEAVSVTGGHLGAGLGVVELTVALHHVFNTPDDRLIWDVGHQCYPHKILTGRRDRMRTLRQPGGLSGFTKRSESEFDPFGTGHSSTSISAALGMERASHLKGEDRHVIALIGDGAMSAGMAYEAINNAGMLNSRLIIILNDNRMSIAPPTGALNAYLARLISQKIPLTLKDFGKPLKDRLARFFGNKSVGLDDESKTTGQDKTLFEEMGFFYLGPVDGHNLDHLVPALHDICDGTPSPVLLHVVTQKGKGYKPAETAEDKYHGVSKFDIDSGTQHKSPSNAPSYTSVFAQSLIKQAAKDKRIVAITAAMPSGTGVEAFHKAYPDRAFDVGIAEQHAVTFAAGLASEGHKPFCAIYSTFLQRAYDQVVHDVAIQKLPVRFAIDRAGYVGADGPTHAGAFDIGFLASLPNMVVMAAGDEAELTHMVATAASYDDGPIAFRYPRGEGLGVDLPDEGIPLEIGKGRMVKQADSAKIAILSFGARLSESLKAAEWLDGYGLPTSVADARFAKPLDRELILKLAGEHDLLITIEEGASGGFSAQVLHLLANEGALEHGLKIRSLTMADKFTDHNRPAAMYADSGLDAQGIIRTAFEALDRDFSEAIERLEIG